MTTWVIMEVGVRGGYNTPPPIATSSMGVSATLTTAAVIITLAHLTNLLQDNLLLTDQCEGQEGSGSAIRQRDRGRWWVFDGLYAFRVSGGCGQSINEEYFLHISKAIRLGRSSIIRGEGDPE
jgi:hypothetical protein